MCDFVVECSKCCVSPSEPRLFDCALALFFNVCHLVMLLYSSVRNTDLLVHLYVMGVMLWILCLSCVHTELSCPILFEYSYVPQLKYAENKRIAKTSDSINRF